MKPPRRNLRRKLALVCAGAGSLFVALAQPDFPYIPSPRSVTIHHERTSSAVAVRVDVDLPDPCHKVASWGEPVRTGSRFRAESGFYVSLQTVCPMIVVSLSHTYELGDLSPGDYEFVFSASGTVLKT